MTADLAPQTTSNDLRNEPRFEPKRRQDLRVQIRRADQDDAISGEIVDLSPGGAKIAIPVGLDVDAETVITLQAGSQCIERRAMVRWCRPARDGWWAGLSFSEDLSRQHFNALAAVGLIDRRRDTRISHSATMTARWELGSKPIPVELMDLSSGGFKMYSPESGEVGKRVLIATENHSGSPILAKVQWQHGRDDGFEIGCAFVDMHGCGTLMQQLEIERPELKAEDAPEQAPRRLWGLVLGVGMVAVVGLVLATPPGMDTLRALIDLVR